MLEGVFGVEVPSVVHEEGRPGSELAAKLFEEFMVKREIAAEGLVGLESVEFFQPPYLFEKI